MVGFGGDRNRRVNHCKNNRREQSRGVMEGHMNTIPEIEAGMAVIKTHPTYALIQAEIVRLMNIMHAIEGEEVDLLPLLAAANVGLMPRFCDD